MYRDKVLYLANRGMLTEDDAEILASLASDQYYPLDDIIKLSLLGLSIDDIIKAILNDVPANLIEAAIRYSGKGTSALSDIDGIKW